MESQPLTPEFRINPENFHPCIYKSLKLAYLIRSCEELCGQDWINVGFFQHNIGQVLS